MKIWVIGRGYPATSNGMWGSFELDQAKLLARGGNEVCYIALTLSFFKRREPRGFRRFEENGVSIYIYSQFYFPGKMGIYLEKFEDECWRRLLNEAEGELGMPELIHVHYPSMISSTYEINQYRQKGVKLFVTEHWSRVLINNLKKHEMIRLRYYGLHANCFISVGQQLLDAACCLTDISVPKEIIPDLASPLFRIAEKKKFSDIFMFIIVGRLVPIKQFDLVIKQFIERFDGNDKVMLKVIGSGKARASLERIAVGCHQIQFTGALNPEDVAKEIAGADALISYSKYETFCVPVVEAWMCGKPAIISNKAGISSYMTKERGIEVPFDCPAQLGRAMIDMYHNYDKYDSEKIAGYAEHMFSEKTIYEKLIELYKKY